MNLSDYLQHILRILEEAGYSAVPLDSHMREPAEPGLYYSGAWERTFLCSPDHEHGILGLELLAVDSCLSDALKTAEEVRSALSDGLGMRIAECRVNAFQEGERAIVRLTVRCLF